MIGLVCVRRLNPAFFIFLICISAAGFAFAAQFTETVPKTTQNDPLVRPRKQQKPVKTESAYKKWLEEEVKDIITPEEEAAFHKLTNDSERQSFIEAFWRRRDPTPDTQENEFKEEHYRRLAYANDHFSAGVEGSKTDRGRIYIIHGPPDSIEAHPAGGPYERPAEEGGGQTSTYPFEIWRYRNIDGIGQEVEIEFVDTCGCGAYHLSYDRGEKDALSHVPNAGLTLKESMGLDSKANRGRNGIDTLGSSFFGNNQSKEFDILNINAQMMAPPPVKFKDLKEVVDIKMRYNLLPFDVRIDFIKGSAETTLVPVTIQVANRNLAYVSKDGIQHASVNIYGRVTTLGGKIVSTFEEPLKLDVPNDLLEKFIANSSIYQQGLPLHAGRYRLDLVLKDVNGDKLGTLYQGITVPDFGEEKKLSASSLVLADKIEPVPARETGTGPFVLGTIRMRPRVPPASGGPATFMQGQKVNLWMQVYNLSLNQQSNKSSAVIRYQVANMATGVKVFEQTENTEQISNPGDHLTLQKTLLPENLQPGIYEVTITVSDQIARQSVEAKTKFAVQ